MQLKQVEHLFRSQSRNLVISSVFFLALVLIFQYPLVQANYDGCVASNYSQRVLQQNSSLEEILLLLKERYTKFQNVHCLSEDVGKKYLIYQCQKSFSGFKYCAGLGDRLRGIISGFYMSILTNRCFGIDWEQISDISSFYQLPVPSYRELKGKSEYTIRSELGGESALLRKINGMNESDIWKEKDIVYFLSNEISWPTITIQDEIISNPSFSFLSRLTPYDQAYIALRLLFSIRTPFFEEEFIKLYSQICQEEVTIGVQMRLTERRYNADDEYLISECFIPEMINSCLLMLKGNEKKKSCVFFVASDIPPSDIRSYFFDHMKEKLDLFVEKKRIDLKYRIVLNSLTSYHLDNFRFLYFIFGYYNIREFLGTFLDWEMLKWMDMLLISESGFSQTIFWYSGVPTKILKLLPNGKCIFPYALKDGFLYNVSL